MQKNVQCPVGYDEGPQDDTKVTSNTFRKAVHSDFGDEYNRNRLQDVAASEATTSSLFAEDGPYEIEVH
jgi:hypothetical protein